MSYRGVVSVFALAIWLAAFPLLAGQSRQEEAPATDEPSVDESTPREVQEGPSPPYQRVPETLTLKTGVVMTVRVSQFLSSDQNRPGDGFTAELDQPLVVDGWVVARRGQTVLGRVAIAQKAGRVKGTSQLGVELSQLVLVDGQQLPIRTQLLQTSGGTSEGRDAQTVGTAAGVGAAIGAGARGGEGAGIGAAIGAGAGLAGVLLTRGRPTVIPPETSLTFQLLGPVAISTSRSGPAFRPVAPEDYNSGTLRRRTQHFATAPYPPRPSLYYPWYSPWGYYYPAPFFFGVYSFGPRFHHRGYRHRGYYYPARVSVGVNSFGPRFHRGRFRY